MMDETTGEILDRFDPRPERQALVNLLTSKVRGDDITAEEILAVTGGRVSCDYSVSVLRIEGSRRQIAVEGHGDWVHLCTDEEQVAHANGRRARVISESRREIGERSGIDTGRVQPLTARANEHALMTASQRLAMLQRAMKHEGKILAGKIEHGPQLCLKDGAETPK